MMKLSPSLKKKARLSMFKIPFFRSTDEQIAIKLYISDLHRKKMNIKGKNFFI